MKKILVAAILAVLVAAGVAYSQVNVIEVPPNGARFQVLAFKYDKPSSQGYVLERVLVGGNVEFYQVRWTTDIWVKNEVTGGYGWKNILDERTPLLKNIAPAVNGPAKVVKKIHIFPARLTRANYQYRLTAYLSVQARGGRMQEGFQQKPIITKKFRPI